jgi:enterochelin esterase-like enzyme
VPLARRSFLLTSLTGALAALQRGCADSQPPAHDGAASGGEPRPLLRSSPSTTPASSSSPAAAQAPSATPSATQPAAEPDIAPTAAQLAAAAELDLRDIQVSGERALGRRFLLCVPKYVKPGAKLPLLVLLHGLGETGDEELGIHAWVDRYGLRAAHERLKKPPIQRAFKRNEWTDARLAEVNASLEKAAYSGACYACPYTPNVNKLANPAGSLDAYATWITEVVIPRARKEAPVHAEAARTAIDGCSLGGSVALEVFVRKPAAFGALGGVQAAFGEARAQGYADRLAAALASGAKPLHFLTSSADPFLAGNQRVAAALRKKGVEHDLRVLPGPHDQPWLREAGTIEMLLWHDRRKAA